MRVKLLDAVPSSKAWWANARRLTDRKQGVSNIPALKRGTECILEAAEKANCFANAFESNNVTIDLEVNEYSEVPYVHPTFFCGMPTIAAGKLV